MSALSRIYYTAPRLNGGRNLVVAAVTIRGGSDARVRLCEIVSYEIFSDDPAF